MSSLGYVTKSFNGAARSETGFGFGLGEQKTAPVTQKQTVLQALGSKVKTNISASNLGGISNIKAAGVGAASAVKQGQAQAASVKAEAGNVKAAISADIRQAKGEIAATLKEMGGQTFGQIFPDQRMGAGGEAQFFGTAALMAAVTGAAFAGKGTFSAFGKKMSSGLDGLFSGLKGGSKNRAQVMAELQERLVEQSAAPQDTRMENSGPLVDTSAATNEKQSQFDWKNFFEGGGDLEAIAYADPDNPPEKFFPEFHEADRAEGGAIAAIEKLDGVSAEIAANGFEKGGSDETAVFRNSSVEKVTEQFNQRSAAEIAQQSEGSLGFLKLKIENAADIAVLNNEKIKSVIQPKNDHEPNIRKLVDFSKPPISMGSAA